MNKSYLIPLIAIGLVLGTIGTSNAAIQAVTGGNFSGSQDLDGEYNAADATFSQLTTAGGTLTGLSGPTSFPVDAATLSTFYFRGDADVTTSFDNAGTLSGFLFTAGTANGVRRYDFGGLVGTKVIYLLEFDVTGADNDAWTISPIDGSNNLIGNYSLALTNNAHFGDTGVRIDPTLDNGANIASGRVLGVTFTAADFTGTTGDLSLMTGIRVFTGGSNAGDTLAVGVGTFAVVPSPAALPAGLGLLGLTLMRRRLA